MKEKMTQAELEELNGRTIWFRTPYKDVNYGTAEPNAGVNGRGQLYVRGIVGGLDFSMNVWPKDAFLSDAELYAANMEDFQRQCADKSALDYEIKKFKGNTKKVRDLARLYREYQALGEVLGSLSADILGMALNPSGGIKGIAEKIEAEIKDLQDDVIKRPEDDWEHGYKAGLEQGIRALESLKG